ncbi:MAG TPA: hypothetical protein VK784_08145 [Pseudonocardiaceae bacterium]|nr:hypothetical protein [Pseudonocardiaceae bacterium]
MAPTSSPATRAVPYWWAIKLCRFTPGELDPYDPTIRRLPPDAPIPR